MSTERPCRRAGMMVRSKAAVVAWVMGLVAVNCAPAGATDRLVRAGGDLQAALDAARPGDTILLEPGATYVGNFRLPVHGGTTHVTVRSAASDAMLPSEGMRIGPADAPQLPRIRSPNSQPAMATAPGAAYWRLMFIEFQANNRGYYDILTLGDGSAAQRSLAQVPHHLIVDRVYVHGDPVHGQKRGITINSGATTIANSYVSDIKAVGQDSQALGGWNGPGPYTIENNYLEAAGEVFLLGGSDPSIPNLVTADVVLRGNMLTRPLSWRDPVVPAPGRVAASASAGGRLSAGRMEYRIVAQRQVNEHDAISAPSAPVSAMVNAGERVMLTWTAVPDASAYRVYRIGPDGRSAFWTVTEASFADDGRTEGSAGKPPSPTLWQVKNLLELKNARRVRIEHNVLEHNWAQAQTGVAVLFTPRNQDGKCGWCVVEDVVFEYNIVRGVGGGITILGHDDEKPSQQARNFRIRHNQFVDISRSWGGTGYFLHIMGEPRDVVIDHNTIVSPDGAGIVAVDGPPVRGFVFTNNVARHNKYGIIGSNHSPGMNTIPAFFPDGVITRNVFADNVDRYAYPPGNEFPAAASFTSQFTNYAAGNFALKPDSAWKRAGTDGQDLGAGLDVSEAPRSPVRPDTANQ